MFIPIKDKNAAIVVIHPKVTFLQFIDLFWNFVNPKIYSLKVKNKTISSPSLRWRDQPAILLRHTSIKTNLKTRIKWQLKPSHQRLSFCMMKHWSKADFLKCQVTFKLNIDKNWRNISLYISWVSLFNILTF